jgi:signal transduction histidine kinase
MQYADTSAPEAAEAGMPSRRPGVLTRLWRDSTYLFVSFPLAIAAFVVTVTGIALGAGLLVTVLGLPVLTMTAFLARGFAHTERKALRDLLDVSAPSPTYLRADPAHGWLRRTLTPLRDPQSWLDLAFGVLGFVTATLGWCVLVVWWTGAVGGLTWGLWGWTIPTGPDNTDLPELLGFGDGYGIRLAFYLVIGVFFAVTLPLMVRLMALTQSGLSRALLCSRAEMQEQVRGLERGRDAHRTAEAGALRRLERDIHDGPQQRLVRLSMDLGRARKQLAEDPGAAGATLEAAMHQTRETLDELRALSRGIAPPVLVDRGLVAAIEELAARSVVPVELDLGLPGREQRLPDHVEQAAYFLIAESLTNIAKHSGASRSRVTAALAGEALRITVVDDGVGGAHLSKGRGLVGLSDRIRAVDGVLNVVSPAGGPTTVEAEIPCA